MKSTKHVWKRCLSVLLVLCMVGALILPNIQVHAADTDADLWIDPVNGSDANDGTTEATALKTIQAAKTKAAQLSEDGDVVVILKGGTYDATETITFGKAESGKNGHTITYRAASGESAIISGGTRLEGWTLHDAAANIYVTDIPAGTELTRQFYVNGKPQRMAGTEASPTDWAILNTNGYESPAVTDPNTNEYLILDLGEEKIISSLVLYAGGDRASDNKAAGFPKDFTISTSADGVNWTVQAEETDCVAPVARAAMEFMFASVAARFIKLDVTELGNPARAALDQYYLSLSEICVGLTGEENSYDLALIQHMDLSKNLLDDAEIGVGYFASNGSFVSHLAGGYPIEKMLDGDVGTYTSANAQVPGWLKVNGGGNTQAVLAILGETAVPVGGVELSMPYADAADRSWATDFEIQVTSDGENWITVVSQADYDWSKADKQTTFFTFDPVPATQIRLLVHENEIAGNNHHYMRIAELGVYAPATVTADATVTAPAGDDAAKLIDGKLDSYASIDSDIVIDLGASKNIGAVRLYPNYVDGKAVNYITAAKISVSDDGQTYEHVMELTHIAAPAGGAQLLVFPTCLDARFVKIQPTIVTGDTLQLREAEVVPAKVDDPNNPDIISDKIELTADDIIHFGHYYNDTFQSDWTYDSGYKAVDGDYGTISQTKGQQYHWLKDNGGSNRPTIVLNVTQDNGAPTTINTVELAVREDGLCAPYHYTVEVTTSATEDNWTPILEVMEANWKNGNIVKHRFEAIEIYKLRLLCYNLTPNTDIPKDQWSGVTTTFLHLNEISLFNVFDPTNPFDEKLCTQGKEASDSYDYSVSTVEAKNNNEDPTANANKVIDGYIMPSNDIGWLVPESYDLAAYGNLENIEIHVLHLWYHSIFHVEKGSGDGTELYTGKGGSFMPTWVANHYSFIDCVGEWYIDRDELKIYYKADGTMEDKEAILPTTVEIINMTGASNIIFDGISFQHTSWTDPSVIPYEDAQGNTYVPQGVAGWVQVPAGILLHRSHDITFTNCEIANMGTVGIKLTSDGAGNTKNVSITNCAIHDISYSGIILGEVFGHHGYQSWMRVDDTVIRNNYITRIGLDMYDSTAILATYTNGTIIDHNEVCYVPYSGVSTGWGWENEGDLATAEIGNTQVTDNLIYNCMKTNRDGGLFYNLGHQKGSVLSGNYVYNSWDGGDTYENGLYLDMGSSFWEVKNNVVGQNVGHWMHMWTASIKENYWHDNFYVAGAKEWDSGTNNRHENNTAVENGDFSKYPEAVAIMENAGLLDDSVKEGIATGFAPQHNILQGFYPGNSARFIHSEWGWDNVAAEGQVNKTSYDSIAKEIIITVSPTTDLTKIVLSYELEDGWTCDQPSGGTYDFTNPIKFVLKNDGREITWNVTVKNKVVTSGDIAGEDVNFGDLIVDSEKTDWSSPPVRIIAGIAYFRSHSGYVKQTFSNDAIYTFDFYTPLSQTTKDWVAISVRNQDPYTTCLNGNTEYQFNITYNSIEVQKFVNGVRTIFYGDETGYESVYGLMPNKFIKSEVKHSIKCGAVDVDGGVRLFMYVDGNKVFDFVDANNPIQGGQNYFVVYPETQMMGIGKYTNINTAPDTSAVEKALEMIEGLVADDYTEDSYAALLVAVDEVEAIMNAVGGVTADEANQAYTILSEALENLVRKDGGEGPSMPTPDDPDQPDVPGDPGDDPSGKTGDETLIIAFIGLMILSVAGVIAIATLKRRTAR